MPGKLEMFPLLIDKWVGGTKYMSLEEKGLYMELLLYLFTEQHPIKDHKHVARICGIDPRTSARLWAKIGPKFSLNQHGSTHELVTKILNNSGRIKGLYSGAYGGGVPAQEQEQEQEIILDPPIPPLQRENQTQKCASRFTEFWTAYPTKVGKKKCSEIWKRRNLDAIADLIIADVTRRRIDDVKWTEGYIPNPQTYLNGDRWEDDIQTKKVNGNETHKRINQGIDHTDTSWAETYNREYGRGSS